jgi:2-polyprenyl-3-methyl-5-hydroxy-6-metoxy-1,4-benzoquinol methylase
MAEPIACDIKSRAARSGGTSAGPVLQMVRRALARRSVSGGVAVDLGCGRGDLQPILAPVFSRVIAVDAVRYPELPPTAEFVEADLNSSILPLPTRSADAVLAVETIEHLENPRALLREMARITKPGGWVVVTTPNQLSFLSLITLAFKRRFSAFQDVHYPAHITALLESDLLRIASEVGLTETAIEYSEVGRVVLTALPYPKAISRLWPRLCSDNILLIGRVP